MKTCVFETPKEKNLVLHLNSIGLTNEISLPIIRLVTSWITNSGPEWTVQRLKHLKSAFLVYITTSKTSSRTRKNGRSLQKISKLTNNSNPKGFTYDWVKNSQGIPKGPLSALFRYATSPKKIRKALSALMVYTGIKKKHSGTWTKTQYNKAINAIKVGYTDPDSVKSAIEFFGDLYDCTDVRRYLKSEHFCSDMKVRPFASVIRETKTYGQDFLTPFFTGTSLVKAVNLDAFDMMSEEAWETLGFSESHSFVAGKIFPIQEKGLKARVVAMPSLSLQVLTKPLHDLIADLLRDLPWDCTFDQFKGVKKVQEVLKSDWFSASGNSCHSVDISSATDRFPYDIQRIILENYFPAYIPLMDSIVRDGEWEVHNPRDDRDSYVSYKVGQPMGLYGSFPLFALSHGLFVYTLWRMDNPNGLAINAPFVILGDDIVIWDDRLADVYKFWLSLLEVPISYDKTLTSKNHFEFASFFGSSDFVVKGSKMGVTNSSNILDKVYHYDNDFIYNNCEPAVRLYSVMPDILGDFPNKHSRNIPLEDRAQFYLDVLSWYEEMKSFKAPPMTSRFSKTMKWLSTIPQILRPSPDNNPYLELKEVVPRSMSFLDESGYGQHRFVTRGDFSSLISSDSTPFLRRRDMKLRVFREIAEKIPETVMFADFLLSTQAPRCQPWT